MNAWGYIALLAIGTIIGMILMWFMVRDRIQNKKIQIGKNKQKDGTGNVQDLEMEFNEAEGQQSKKDERKEKRDERRTEREADKAARKLKRSNINLNKQNNV